MPIALPLDPGRCLRAPRLYPKIPPVHPEPSTTLYVNRRHNRLLYSRFRAEVSKMPQWSNVHLSPRYGSNHLHNGTTARKQWYRFEALLTLKTSTHQPLIVFLSHRKHVHMFYCLCPINTARVTLQSHLNKNSCHKTVLPSKCVGEVSSSEMQV